jgi:hypothetical protein
VRNPNPKRRTGVNATSNDSKCDLALFHPELVMSESRHDAKTLEKIGGIFDRSI